MWHGMWHMPWRGICGMPRVGDNNDSVSNLLLDNLGEGCCITNKVSTLPHKFNFYDLLWMFSWGSSDGINCFPGKWCSIAGPETCSQHTVTGHPLQESSPSPVSLGLSSTGYLLQEVYFHLISPPDLRKVSLVSAHSPEHLQYLQLTRQFESVSFLTHLKQFISKHNKTKMCQTALSIVFCIDIFADVEKPDKNGRTLRCGWTFAELKKLFPSPSKPINKIQLHVPGVQVQFWVLSCLFDSLFFLTHCARLLVSSWKKLDVKIPSETDYIPKYVLLRHT